MAGARQFQNSQVAAVSCVYRAKLQQMIEQFTKTDGADMCRSFSDVDRRNQVDKEVYDKLPVVDAR